MGKADKKAKQDAVADKRMEGALGQETTDEDRERAEKKGMGAFGGINKGDGACRSALTSPWRRAALASPGRDLHRCVALSPAPPGCSDAARPAASSPGCSQRW